MKQLRRRLIAEAAVTTNWPKSLNRGTFVLVKSFAPRQHEPMPIGPEHLSSLITRYAGPLTLYARQWCDGADGYAPDDVVQEAFMQLARQKAVPDDPPAWLYRTVRNGAISATRRATRRRKHEQSAAAARPDWFRPAPEAVQETAAAVEALQTLDAQTREIVTAHLWGGLTFEQISELIDVSSSTAHRRYREGLEQLRTRLERICTT